MSPHDWSLADRHTGISGYGLTLLPHVRDLIISGPSKVTGVSESPIRQNVFTCRPTLADEAYPCAEEIVSRLARQAYRRPLNERDLEFLMSFYEEGASGGFEVGIRTALQAILASPHFVFRFEEAPPNTQPGESYRISDVDLASRLSFFLWGTAPDPELLGVAERGELSDPEELKNQVLRMLSDRRAESLGPRFAGQWLRLQDLDKVHPDQFWFPDFDQQLAESMRQETELLFNYLVREDRSILDLYSADYTFVNERLARHYGITGVVGDHFRQIVYADDHRRGVLGHGSILTLTSHANRTSPVLRGKWVMEVLLGTPPPPPPPGIPDLEETEGSEAGRMLTTRERMELHRTSPTCNSCHRFIDPIGLALDNYDVTGRWRIRENGMPLDTRGELYDGTPVSNPSELKDALLKRPIPLIRTFTENLMAYALGRRVEYYDQPTVRSITRAAGTEGYRMSAFILGVVESEAFQVQQVASVVDNQLKEILELIPKHNLQGIVATNTTTKRPDTNNSRCKAVYDQKGGLSGFPLKDTSTEVIRKIYRMTDGKIPIIGVGGIFNDEDAWEKITAGASLIQLYTGLVFEGPGIARSIMTGLKKRVKEAGFESISEAVGINA